MRTFAIAAATAGVMLSCFSAIAPASAAGTTRIETRPFYGAVVTIEEGVRVFRPLPPTERVIVNPGGRTPLSLGFNETYVNERNYNYNYNEVSESDGGGAVGGIYGGYGYGYGRDFGRGPHHKGHVGGRSVGPRKPHHHRGKH